MKSVFNWFKHPFKKWYRPDSVMQKHLESLVINDIHAASCEEIFLVLDQFAEAAHRGENVLLFMPLVCQHLDVCPTCREEYEALLRMMQPPLDS